MLTEPFITPKAPQFDPPVDTVIALTSSPGQPNCTKLYCSVQLELGYLYSAISDTSNPNRRYFGSVINRGILVVPAPSTGTNLFATAIKSFEIITRFKGEKSLYDFSRQQKARAVKRTCQFLCPT